jgi:maltose alpha-D-glucosyltransferase/alpha-amylase
MARGFTRIPALAGALFYDRAGLEPGTLAVVQTAVGHQGSGWQFTIDELRRYYETVAARARVAETPQEASRGDEPPPLFAATEGWYLAVAQTLGRRTADMHLALADSNDPDFAPEPFADRARKATHRDMKAHAERVLDLLASKRDSLPEAVWAQADAVLAARAVLLKRLDVVARGGSAGMCTRVHGDYHLGQVLRTQEDFVILDFEGEPARTLAERRARQSPLKDVAGMIRSFSYAAYAALFTFTINAPGHYGVLEPWADTWCHWASRAFLSGYRLTLGVTPLVPPAREMDRLLGAFILEKALYELGYELNNRPEWVRIPLTGILKAL